jgi:hypothetical protein
MIPRTAGPDLSCGHDLELAYSRVAEIANLLENSFDRGDIALANKLATGLIAETEKLMAVAMQRRIGEGASVAITPMADGEEVLENPVLHRQIALAREVVLMSHM